MCSGLRFLLCFSFLFDPLSSSGRLYCLASVSWWCPFTLSFFLHVVFNLPSFIPSIHHFIFYFLTSYFVPLLFVDFPSFLPFPLLLPYSLPLSRYHFFSPPSIYSNSDLSFLLLSLSFSTASSPHPTSSFLVPHSGFSCLPHLLYFSYLLPSLH